MSTRVRKGMRRMVSIQPVIFSAMVALLSMAFSKPAAAQCSTPGHPACPGTLLTTYYQTAGSAADNMIELINPTGSANFNLIGVEEHDICAMIYVFDANENLGECCGCLISSQGLLTLSVEKSLTANWGLSGGAPSSGAIEVVSANPGGNGDCNAGAGFTTTRELNGDILRYEIVAPNQLNGITAAGGSEVQLQDAGDLPSALQTSLIARCAALPKNAACGCIMPILQGG